MRSCASVSRNSLGAYSRISTAVPPMSKVPRNQLFNGDECHMGMAISVRSVGVSEVAAAAHRAAWKTLAWLCRQPLGWPVVPEV